MKLLIIFISGMIIGLIFGDLISTRFHHDFKNSSNCTGCEIEFDKGYEWGLKDATVKWDQWK